MYICVLIKFILQELLSHQDFDKFTSLKLHLLDTVERMLTHDIAEMMALIPHQTAKEQSANIDVYKRQG